MVKRLMSKLYPSEEMLDISKVYFPLGYLKKWLDATNDIVNMTNDCNCFDTCNFIIFSGQCNIIKPWYLWRPSIGVKVIFHEAACYLS